MNDGYVGEKYLNKIYKKLYKNYSVVRSSYLNDSKEVKIKKYLKRIESIEKYGLDKKIYLLKSMFYDKYVISEENIKEGYFERLKTKALEKGYGYIEFDDLKKKKYKDGIIKNQKKSLEIWIDYLLSSEYPEWFKYFVFQGMVRLGSYDRESDSFNKRTSSTTKSFIELNCDAISLMYEVLSRYLLGNEVSDDGLKNLLKNGNFSKLYIYMIKKSKENRKNVNSSNDGIWVKFTKGTEPEELLKKIESRGTGWCTVGIETARSQLEAGDLYIYFTKDYENNYSQPRIGIRTEGDQIVEIRGVAKNQNLEPEMIPVVAKKLKTIPNSYVYYEKVKDMKKLTKIYKEHLVRELSIEELLFLYQVNKKINGFGWTEDPRINEVILKRDIDKDHSLLANYLLENYKNGNLNLSFLKSLKGIKLPSIVSGNLYLNSIESTEELELPQRVFGDLYLNNIKCGNVVLPNYVGGDLILSKLENAKGVVFPKIVDGIIKFNNLNSPNNLVLPKKYNGLHLFLNTCKGLSLPDKYDGDLLINCNDPENLNLPSSVGGNLVIGGFKVIDGIKLPSFVGGDFSLLDVQFMKKIILPREVLGNISLFNVSIIYDVVFPSVVGGSINCNALVDFDYLKLPDKVENNVLLSSLNSLNNVLLPQNIGGTLFILNVEDEMIVLPSNYENCVNVLAKANVFYENKIILKKENSQ